LNDSLDRCNLSGDGTAEAALLVQAGRRQREAAVGRIDGALPGFDALGRSTRCGLDTLTVLQVDPDLLDTSVTLGAIDELLAVGDLGNERGLIVDGSTNRGLPIRAEVRSPTLGPSTAVNVEPFAALAELRGHNTIVLNEAHRRVGPAAADLADDLATAFRSATQINAYLSLGDAPGFGAHWDDHDVIIVQVAGQKYWEVHNPSEIGALTGFTPKDVSGEVAWSGVLGMGHALAVPRGWAHRVEGIDGELSVHLTFSNRRATGLDLFGRIHPDSSTFGKDLGADELEQCYGSWYADLVGLPRNGPIELLAAQAAGYDGYEVGLCMLGGVVFRPAACTEKVLALRANRRDVEVGRGSAAALAHAVSQPWWTVEELCSHSGLERPDIIDLVARLGAAGLVRLRTPT
jgi:hypothetical protein